VTGRVAEITSVVRAKRVERLARLLSDLFGLEISEGALANILQDSAPAFETQASAIKRCLLSGTAALHG
jgi:hypothetical protein